MSALEQFDTDDPDAVSGSSDQGLGPGDVDRALDQGPAPAPWWVVLAGITGRVWLALVTGALLFATLPALLPGWSARVVVSDSMAPRINAGDVVLSQERDDYQPGQVIAFNSGDRGAITHRIVSVQDGTYTTQGDANPTPDSDPVAASDVLGLGRVLVMFAGLPWLWVHTGQWLPLLAFVLSLVLAAWAVAADRPPSPSRNQGASDEGADGGSGDGLLDDFMEPEPEQADPDGTEPAWGPAAFVAPGAPGARRLGRFPGPRRVPIPAGWRPVVATPMAVVAGAATLVALSLPATSAAFTARTTNVSNTWRAALTYAATVLADSPYLYLRVNEAQPANASSTSAAADSSTNAFSYNYTRASSGNFSASFTLGSAASANMSPLPNTSARLLQDGACILPGASQPSLSSPQTFSVEAWIRTTAGSTEGGKIMGFENSRTTTMASQYDRHLYMDGSGYVYFGIWTGSTTVVRSSAVLNDGTWHHVVGTLNGAGGTMRLYVDGAQAGQVAAITAETTTGWWRIGCGNLSGWTSSPAWSGAVPGNLTANQSFIGYIDEPAVYLNALSAAQVLAHYERGRP